ncbi:MAG: hypothetical protein WCQ47_05000 [bacterium]
MCFLAILLMLNFSNVVHATDQQFNVTMTLFTPTVIIETKGEPVVISDSEVKVTHIDDGFRIIY